ncbi:hypothetical protein L1987_20921 [Smallanthus sonchifolius]|uniref:Uncharacterized protein n=1 Tax=Smallanthus sonchifolius TaxID=185202 RepID=A0ACB9ITN8_9ASTR|nr:hypothetical protein L1987_20921 [Smallanthus sonchifolius]
MKIPMFDRLESTTIRFWRSFHRPSIQTFVLRITIYFGKPSDSEAIWENKNDCFGRPISSPLGVGFNLVEHISNDNNKTLNWWNMFLITVQVLIDLVQVPFILDRRRRQRLRWIHRFKI